MRVEIWSSLIPPTRPSKPEGGLIIVNHLEAARLGDLLRRVEQEAPNVAKEHPICGELREAINTAFWFEA